MRLAIALILTCVGFFSASRARADAQSTQRALVGQWIAADANASAALVFGDGSWAFATGGKATAAGSYRWNTEDIIRLESQGMVVIWRVQIIGDTLQLADRAGTTSQWFRVNQPSPPTRPPSETPTPAPRAVASQLATVRLVGAVMGLTKTDGRSWDPGGTFSQEDLTRFRSAAWKLAAKGVASGNAATAMAGIVGVIGPAVIAKKAKPDPMGTTELLIDGQRVGTGFNLPYTKDNQDTFTPLWSPGRWQHVPLDGKHDVRLKVVLKDYDWADGDDPVGDIEITRENLLDAARFGKVFPVYVGDQSEDQIMFVKISVTLESGSEAQQ